MRRPGLLLGAILSASTLVAGCSSSAVVDDGALQEGIASSLAKQVGDSWTVSCPDGQPAEAGHTFTCEAVSAKDGATVTITVLEDDDLGNVTWQTVDDSLTLP